MSSRYAGRQINALGAPGGGTGQVELSVFRCLVLSANSIAIDAMILISLMGPY